jgi:cytosine/creatinine deaminase
VELINIEHRGCIELMARFITEHPELWNEEIGVPPRPPRLLVPT